MELSRMTVIKYLKLKEAPIRSDNSILDNYIPLIKKCQPLRGKEWLE